MMDGGRTRAQNVGQGVREEQPQWERDLCDMEELRRQLKALTTPLEAVGGLNADHDNNDQGSESTFENPF